MKNNKTNVSFSTTVSIDTEYYQLKNPNDYDIHKDLYEANGWGYYRISNDNQYVHESRIVSSGKSSSRKTLFHTNRSYAYSTKKKGKSYGRDDGVSFKFAGISSHITKQDEVKRHARDAIVDYLKISAGECRYRRLDIPVDIEQLTGDVSKFNVDNFFFIQLSKAVNINSPFDFYVNENDGSKTYYQQKSAKPSIQTIEYLKHIKEGLDDQFILRLENAYHALIKFGDDPEKIIKYIEKDLKTKRLFFFENADDCHNFKQQYRNNILKKDSPNVPDKLLREIKLKATEEFVFSVLPDEIKDHIRNVLTKDTEPKEVKKSPARLALTSPSRKSKKVIKKVTLQGIEEALKPPKGISRGGP
jgi:hypothetical protein